MTTIEDELKTLIDSFTWSVGVQGITKDTYVWSESLAKTLNLNNPRPTSPNIIGVIHPSVSSIITQSSASKVVQYIGPFKIYAALETDMQAALTNYNIIFDSDDFLNVTFDGINGSIIRKKYNNEAIYQWDKRRDK
jgi:hypothetical protein